MPTSSGLRLLINVALYSYSFPSARCNIGDKALGNDSATRCKEPRF